MKWFHPKRAEEMLKSPYKPVKTPIRVQEFETECGAVCLGIISSYYGKWIDGKRLRELCGVSRDATRADFMYNAAKGLDFDVHAYRRSLENIYPMQPPFIAYWQNKHWIVVEGFKGNWVYVNDPAQGRNQIPLHEFKENYSEIVISLIPQSHFKKEGSPPQLRHFFKMYLKGVAPSLVFGSICNVLLIIPSVILAAISNIFIQDVLTDKLLSWEPWFLVAFFFVAFISIFVLALKLNIFNRTITFLQYQISEKMIKKMFKLDMSFFTLNGTGMLAPVFVYNNMVASIIPRLMIDIITGSISILCIGIVLFFYSKIFAAICYISLIIDIFCMYLIYKKNKNTRYLAQNRHIESDKICIEGIQSIEELKISSQEQSFMKKFLNTFIEYVNQIQIYKWVNAYLASIPHFIEQLCQIFILLTGAFLVMTGQMSIGTFMGANLLILTFFRPVQTFSEASTLSQNFYAISMVSQDFFALGEDFLSQIPFMKKELHTFEGTGSQKELSIIHQLSGDIKIKNVVFGYGYKEINAPNIVDIDLHIKPRQIVGIVGNTGCGKSTLANLISGLFTPWQGEIYYDDKKIDAFDRLTISQSISVVSQKIYLFTDTVYNNLTLWDSSFTREEIENACKMACIHEDIMSLKQGYETVILEHGKNLSGGQRQRIEIARGLLNKPSILIMDEATSALDTITEQKVMQNILSQGITCIMVAHRISTIKSADQIVVMDQGRIIHIGTHEELKDQSPEYRMLIDEDGIV